MAFALIWCGVGLFLYDTFFRKKTQSSVVLVCPRLFFASRFAPLKLLYLYASIGAGKEVVLMINSCDSTKAEVKAS